MKKQILIDNNEISLMQYTHDDRDFYNCWLDIDTQKGYNGRFEDTFEQFCMHNI